MLSRLIACNCKGLPLAVVMVSGILKTTERRKESWEQAIQRVNILRTKRGENWSKTEFNSILDRSYSHFPDCLKSCFLYFGRFQVDTPTYVSHLIKLWISEGMVKEENLGEEILEEKAKSYLDELIDRNLIMISKRSSNGGVKACHIHDVVRNFISEKGRLVYQEPMHGGLIYFRVDPSMGVRSIFYYNRLNREPEFGEVHLLGDYPKRENLSERPVFMDKPKIDRDGISLEAEVPVSTPNYRFLLQHAFIKVLDLANVRVESSADSSDLVMITTLVNLRYLAIRFRETRIPCNIGNLRNLETLIITGAIGYIFLPESLWNQFSLRHVQLGHGFFDFQHCSKTLLEDFSQHGKLKSVSTLCLRHGDDVDKLVLCKLTGIKKLGCKFFADSWDDSAEHFPFLEQLVVSSCPRLKKIPSSFGEISTLQSIEIKWCKPSTMSSANQILDLQHDYGNPQFSVTHASFASVIKYMACGS